MTTVRGIEASSIRGSHRVRWSAERQFYSAMTIAITASVLLGFSRTFFLRPLFPEWAAEHSPTEPFFYVHGVVFATWFALLVAQPFLVATGRIDLHRRLGWLGAGLAVAILGMGTLGALLAAGRPTGFVDVPIPPLQFLAIPLVEIWMFGAFAGLAVIERRRTQSHKRYMLLASISLLSAAITRWPFAVMAAELPVPWFNMTDVLQDGFLVPILAWDFASRGRIHAVTLWGGLALVASQPVKHLLSVSDVWVAFATWAVALLG